MRQGGFILAAGRVSSKEEKNTKKSRRTRSSIGCSFAVFVMLMVVLLLTINSIITSAFFRAAMVGVDSRIVNPLQFISTVLLVFFEYWVFDKVTSVWFQRKNDQAS